MLKALLNFRNDYRQLKTTLIECTAEIDRVREQMKADDIEIAANSAKIDAAIAEIKAMRVEDERRWKKL